MCKLCLGAVLIFAPIFSFAITPDYIPLEYIESSGYSSGYANNPIIEISSIKNTANSVLEHDMGWYLMFNSASHPFSTGFDGKGAVVFHYLSGTGRGIILNNKYVNKPNGSTYLYNVPIRLDIKFQQYSNNNLHIEVNEGDTKVVDYTDNNVSSGFNNSNLFIFAPNVNSINRMQEVRLYYYKLYRDGNLIFDGIPAKRNSDNELGLYDIVNDVFYAKTAGHGSFKAGPEIVLPPTISITWDGLSEPEASGMCVYGETFTAPSTAPTAPSGLKFLGWRPR